MGHGGVLGSALGLGFAGGCLGAFLLGGAPAGESEGEFAPGGQASAAALARLEARVDALAASTRSSRGAEPARARTGPDGSLLGAGTTAPAAPTDGAPQPAAAANDASPSADPGEALRSLEARVTALEKSGRGGTVIPKDLSKVPAAEMEALLRNLQGEKRYDEAFRVADEYSKRGDLTADQRTEADLYAGYSLRGLGKHGEAEARFRETLGRVGEQSEKAAWVGFQIGWERSYQKDPAGAANEMEKSANHPAVTPIVRVHSLYNAGRFAMEAGETARARELLQRLLRDYAGDIPSSQQFLKTESENLLKQLEGK